MIVKGAVDVLLTRMSFHPNWRYCKRTDERRQRENRGAELGIFQKTDCVYWHLPIRELGQEALGLEDEQDLIFLD